MRGNYDERVRPCQGAELKKAEKGHFSEMGGTGDYCDQTQELPGSKKQANNRGFYPASLKAPPSALSRSCTLQSPYLQQLHSSFMFALGFCLCLQTGRGKTLGGRLYNRTRVKNKDV